MVNKISELSCTAYKVLTRLLITGDMTYSEIREKVGINRSALSHVMDELLSLEPEEVKVQVFSDLNDKRVRKARATLLEVPIVEDHLSMAMRADQSSDKNLKDAAVFAVWEYVFPKSKFPNFRRTKLLARQMLRKADGSVVNLLDILEIASMMDVQYPRAYSETLLKQYRTEQLIEKVDAIREERALQLARAGIAS